MAGYKKILLDGDSIPKLVVDGDSTLTVASGVVTATKSYHSIAGEGGNSDNLDVIDGGVDGMIMVIRPSDDADTITVRHNQDAGGGGNIFLNGDSDFAMDDIDDTLTLIYDAGLDGGTGAWIEVSRGPSGGGVSLTSNAPANVGTSAAVGSGTAAAKDDHVHDTDTGFIDNANKFASGVVDAAAIGSNAVAASEIDETATNIAFAQIILTPASAGTGTAEGTLFYDSDDDHLYVYQA